MEAFESVSCPVCGSAMELSIDTSIPEQLFTTDCEVCCRPFTVQVECEPGTVVSFSILEN